MGHLEAVYLRPAIRIFPQPCRKCGRVLQSAREERYHKKNCADVGVHLQTSDGRKTNTVLVTPDQTHSSPNVEDISHLTHPSGTSSSIPDFDVLSPIKTPKANEKSTWKTIDEHFKMLHATNPLYKPNDQPSTKLIKLNSFTYNFFKHDYGCKEPNEKAIKRQKKSPYKKNLRKLKRELKQEWKRNKYSDNIDELKKRYFKVMKLLNIMRKQETEVERAIDFQRQTKSFRENPNKFAKKLYDSAQKLEPNFSSQEAEDFFRETYADSSRGMTYQHPPLSTRPLKPDFPFKCSPPTKE